MSPEVMEGVAEGYTFGSIVGALAAIGCGIGYAEQPQHRGWLVAALGLLAMTVVASVRRAKFLKDAERARALEKAGLE